MRGLWTTSLRAWLRVKLSWFGCSPSAQGILDSVSFHCQTNSEVVSRFPFYDEDIASQRRSLCNLGARAQVAELRSEMKTSTAFFMLGSSSCLLLSSPVFLDKDQMLFSNHLLG